MMTPLDKYINKVIQGDCLEVMKEMPDKCVDLVLTDPPYGVGIDYGSFDDTQENLKKLVADFMPEALRVGKLVVLTCGVVNQWHYPVPDWVLAWGYTAGQNSSKWGFSCWQPILVYGKDPYLANGKGRRADLIIDNTPPKKYGHPVTKPIEFWSKLLNRVSVKETDIVLDPFGGSCTTAVACKQLKRNYICIEKEEKYVKICHERLAGTTSPLF